MGRAEQVGRRATALGCAAQSWLVRRRHLRSLQAAPWDDPDAMARLQQERLRQIVERAAAGTPLMRRRLAEAGLEPRDLSSSGGLAALPPISKGVLLGTDRSDYIDPTVRGAAGMTSGTSGEPFPLWFERTWWARSQATRVFLYRRLGVEGGRVVESMKQTPRGLAPGARDRAFPHFDRRVLPFTLPVGEQVDHVERLEPQVLYGNRSAHVLLAEELRRRGRRPRRLRLAISTGEVLTPEDRQLIGEGYGVPVHDLYGQSEFSVVAWQDRPEGGYRLMAPGVIAEVLRDGRPAAPGEVGEVVLTGLQNSAMPLVRFATGDLAQLSADSAPSGHPAMRIERIVGREIDLLRTTTGERVHPAPAVYGPPWHTAEVMAVVRRHQVEQLSLDHVRVHLETSGPLAQHLQDRIRDHLRDFLGPLHVEIVPTAELALGRNGKYKQVVSHV